MENRKNQDKVISQSGNFDQTWNFILNTGNNRKFQYLKIRKKVSEIYQPKNIRIRWKISAFYELNI